MHQLSESLDRTDIWALLRASALKTSLVVCLLRLRSRFLVRALVDVLVVGFLSRVESPREGRPRVPGLAHDFLGQEPSVEGLLNMTGGDGDYGVCMSWCSVG